MTQGSAQLLLLSCLVLLAVLDEWLAWNDKHLLDEAKRGDTCDADKGRGRGRKEHGRWTKASDEERARREQ